MNTPPSLSTEEYQLLAKLLAQECGIVLGNEKGYLIESRLAQLMAESGCETYREFYLKAKDNFIPGLKLKIVDAMTTKETLWFRDDLPFTAMSEVLWPEYNQQLAAGNRRELRIWSAACSTGQEPYSIAMSVMEYARQPGAVGLERALSILATDISASAIFMAKAGWFNPIAMSRGLSPELTARYFTKEGNIYVIDDAVKRLVTFKQHNLQDPFASLGAFDIVLLRNVAIYFSLEFKRELLAKIAKILRPGGYLFLGASESLTGLSEDFILKQHDRCIYYQVKE